MNGGKFKLKPDKTEFVINIPESHLHQNVLFHAFEALFCWHWKLKIIVENTMVNSQLNNCNSLLYIVLLNSRTFKMSCATLF